MYLASTSDWPNGHIGHKSDFPQGKNPSIGGEKILPGPLDFSPEHEYFDGGTPVDGANTWSYSEKGGCHASHRPERTGNRG